MNELPFNRSPEQPIPAGELPVAPLWYWTARGMDKNQGPTTKRLLSGIDQAADYFDLKLTIMQRALGLVRDPSPVNRLMQYYAKPETYDEALMMFEAGLIKVLYSWESQQAYFPRDYEEDWDDFQSLRTRAGRGEFGPMVQAQETAYIEGQNAMQDLLPAPTNSTSSI